MDARVRPTLFPLIQIALRFGQVSIEAHAFERRFLRVPHAAFHFALAVRIADAARHRHHAVMLE